MVDETKVPQNQEEDSEEVVKYNHSTASFPKPDTPEVTLKIHRKHHRNEVPEIANWHKAFQEFETSGGNFRVTSQTARTNTSVDHLYSRPLTSCRPHPDSQYNEYAIHTARSARSRSDISTTMKTLGLPVKHPQGPSVKNPNEPVLATESEDSIPSTLYSKSLYSSKDPVVEPKPVVVNTRVVPYNSYKKISKTIQQQKEKENKGEYSGYYNEDYVPESERYIKEYVKSKKKFLAGSFKTHFGTANSAMQPGKEGLVRGQGPYPTEPLPGRNEDITAADWYFMKHNEPGRQIAGPWKR